jgi:branched-chain amino acid transport system permease protein
MMEWFSSNEGYVQGVLVTALLAVSVQAALRAGVLSFASVGFYGVGAYGVGYLTTVRAWGVLPSFGLLLILTVSIAFVLALILSRLRALYLAMATMAFVLLIQIAALAWDSVTGGPIGMFGIPPELGTGSVTLILIAALAVSAFTQRGVTGRSFKLLRQDEALASALGVDVRRSHRIAFVWSAALGTTAGVCQANLLTVFTPENLGFPVIVSALTVLVVGGTWHWFGPVIGAALFAWLPLWFAFIGEWRGLAEGLITVVVLIFLPAGIAGLCSTGARALYGFTAMSRPRTEPSGDTASSPEWKVRS